MKKGSLIISGLLCALLLSSCGNATSTTKKDSVSSKSSTSSKVEKASSVKTSEDNSNDTWTFKNNVFSAGIETYKFTKSEIRDSATEGKKILVLYTDVTNNSKKEQDPSNVYMVVLAYQKNNTSNVQLKPGMVAYDSNGNNPLQAYEDNLNNKLLPGKTATAVLEFELENNNPVTVKFNNSDFKVIGEKTYQVQ